MISYVESYRKRGRAKLLWLEGPWGLTPAHLPPLHSPHPTNAAPDSCCAGLKTTGVDSLTIFLLHYACLVIWAGKAVIHHQAGQSS